MKKITLFVMVFVSFWRFSAYAADGPDVIWAGGGLRIADEASPAYMADAFVSLPLVETAYLFSNPTAFIKNEEVGIDLGVGARMPVLSGQAIAGFNLFHDYTTDNHHKRIGAGMEFFHPNFSAHLNLYLPYSDEHNGDKAIPGIDLLAGIPVPNAPFVVIWPGMYFYEGDERSNMEGFSLMLEVKPVKAVSVYFGGRNDAIESGRNNRGEIFAKVEVTIPMKRLGQDLFKFDKGEYPLNVTSQLDHPVMREPFITFEQQR